MSKVRRKEMSEKKTFGLIAAGIVVCGFAIFGAISSVYFWKTRHPVPCPRFPYEGVVLERMERCYFQWEQRMMRCPECECDGETIDIWDLV